MAATCYQNFSKGLQLKIKIHYFNLIRFPQLFFLF